MQLFATATAAQQRGAYASEAAADQQQRAGLRHRLAAAATAAGLGSGNRSFPGFAAAAGAALGATATGRFFIPATGLASSGPGRSTRRAWLGRTAANWLRRSEDAGVWFVDRCFGAERVYHSCSDVIGAACEHQRDDKQVKRQNLAHGLAGAAQISTGQC